jgi:hypothetical protein
MTEKVEDTRDKDVWRVLWLSRRVGRPHRLIGLQSLFVTVRLFAPLSSPLAMCPLSMPFSIPARSSREE